MVFVGIELTDEPADTGLLRKEITLSRYAWYRHIGPHTQLGGVHDAMHAELAKRSETTRRPSLEIYGDWQHDESKLETDVLIGLAEQ